MSKSDLEAKYEAQLVEAGIDGYVREHRFVEGRMFRFDFAWLDKSIGVEIHGGIYVSGGHSRGTGIEKDAEKMAHAALLGWRVLIVPDKWLRLPHGEEPPSEAIRWTKALLAS